MDPPCGVWDFIWLATAAGTNLSIRRTNGWHNHQPWVTKNDPSRFTARVRSQVACGMVRNSAKGHIPTLLTSTSTDGQCL